VYNDNDKLSEQQQTYLIKMKMKKNCLRFMMICYLIIGSMTASAQQVKNVILMIPDGCSLATISTARWYQWMVDPEKEHLSIDPYISGTVRTTCSNSPIGDSAPTTSTFMTGYLGRAGWVSTYPTPDPEGDIYPVDGAKSYQPLMTLLEASKVIGRSTGIVCTAYFPHATPADCSAHWYDRQNYSMIASQQAHNLLNVVISGGVNYLSAESENYLTSSGWDVIKDDVNRMRSCENKNMWALFCPEDMPYEIDRDKDRYPSLAEMTKVALNKLSQNPKGFFLMVEGSKIDFAAHNNDPGSMFTEFLAFDEACHEAIEFAKADGNTAVVMLSDHGNSGLSFGRRDLSNYARTPTKKILSNIQNFRASCEEMAKKVNAVPFEEVQGVFKEWLGFELTNEELDVLKNVDEYSKSPLTKEQKKHTSTKFYKSSLARTIAQFMTERTGLAYTTNGHTGEDVILMSYHPNPQFRATGELTNIEINHYLCSLIGLTHDMLDQLTSQFFAPHKEVLDGVAGVTYKMEKTRLEPTVSQPARPQGGMGGFGGGFPGFGGPRRQPLEVMQLTITTKSGNIVLKSTSNIAEIEVKKGKMSSKQSVNMRTIVLYVDKNDTFYIPRNILSLIQSQN